MAKSVSHNLHKFVKIDFPFKGTCDHKCGFELRLRITGNGIVQINHHSLGIKMKA